MTDRDHASVVPAHGGHVSELLLVGAGHAHLHVVREAAALVAAGYGVTLLAPRFFHYSGVASATAAGAVPATEGRVDVAALAQRAGITFIDGTLAALDLITRVATTAAGRTIGYDVLSLNIGSVALSPPDTAVGPGVLRVKPLSDLVALGELIDSMASAPGARVTVVGGGATGLELAGHLSVRPGVATVRLLEAGPGIGADLPAGARRRLERLLTRRGVEVHRGCAVSNLGATEARCVDGVVLDHDVVVLATGLVAPSLVSEVGLGDSGGIPVRATLQQVDHEEIYAVGDCARFLPRPLPRTGVHGVRQGPVLHASLLARARGDRLPSYRPQRQALAVLDLGAGTGLAVRGRLWWLGRSALLLKRWIDRRWLRTYQTP